MSSFWPVITRPDLKDFWDGETVVAVGNGSTDPLYAEFWAGLPKANSIKQAWQQYGSSRPMILIWPGTYNETLWEMNHSPGRGVFRGMGATPQQVNWVAVGTTYGRNVTFRTGRHRVLFENLRMSSHETWESTLQSYDPDCHVVVNRVDFNHTGSTHAINWRSGMSACNNSVSLWKHMEFHNCRITKGYNQWSHVQFNQVQVQKTLILGTYTGHCNRGTVYPSNWDWRSANTTGYGPDFGENIVQISRDWASDYHWRGVVTGRCSLGPVIVALMRIGDRKILAWTRPNALGAWDLMLKPWFVPEGEGFLLYLADGCRPQIEGPYPPTEIITST